MNRLQHEASPYLRQHAANPVDWQPWDEVALERARREDKPLLLSIGYSTCHWCHVMERESFEDPDIAAYQNAHFINIKVDREERPDLDQFFMQAGQALTGQGGWPLHVFLTPDQRPFYAGTYFPPTPQGRRLSWSQALQYAAYNFYENRQAVEKQADRILLRLQRAEQKALLPLEGLPEQAPPFTGEVADLLFRQLQLQFDAREGGFGPPPKFPNTMALEFLMHYAHRSDSEEARQHALFSLDRLLQGGIYDHLGGGLARYAVDREWRVPHFEKMLYDNALLIRLLADAWRWTGAGRYRRALEQCIAFAERELSSPEGGFYTALDADSEGREGAYYTWQRDEIEAILGEEASWFCDYFQVTESGNWEGHNILIARSSLEQYAEERSLAIDELTGRLDRAVERLHAARQQRPHPHRDEKILLAWNALMVTAYVQAWHALGQAPYRKRAELCLHFLLEKFSSPATGLRHVYQDGEARQPAFLNDYAFLIEALLESYTLRYDTDLLDRAAALTEEALRLFSDEEQRLFYFSAGQSNGPILRRRELYDAEMPSGNALMAANLQRLGLLFDRAGWRERAGRMLQSLLPALTDDPLPYARWATATLTEIDGYDELAIVGPRAHVLAARLQRHFLPNLLLMAHPAGDDHYPLLQHRPATEGTLLYLCRNYTCRRPVDSVEGVLEMIGTVD